MDYISASLSFGIVRRRIQAMVVEALSDLGLTYAEFSLMLLLYDREGCSQDDMTNLLHVDKAAITRVIKKLEERGFLFRRHDDQDRRMKRLYVTDLGRSKEQTIKNIVRRIMDYMTEDLSQQERDLMIRCLHGFAKKIGDDDYRILFGIRGGVRQ